MQGYAAQRPAAYVLSRRSMSSTKLVKILYLRELYS